LLVCWQRAELRGCGFALPVVKSYRGSQIECSPVVQKHRSVAYSPKRHRPHHGRPRSAIRDAVAQRAHVVEQKVAEWMINLVSERLIERPRDRHAACGVRDEPCRIARRDDRGDVAGSAAYALEYSVTAV
jgi:hypothetical protein